MESDIHKWIIEKLSVSLDTFNNMPACPFAKQALIDNKIKVIEISNKEDFTSKMKYYVENWPANIEVLVLGCNPKIITASELTEITEIANNSFLNNYNYLALEDHPAELEYVEEFCVNEGNWALILLQSKDKINSARKILKKRGYYKNWDKDYFKEVVLDRS
jgi:spore coat polysaccharide biosynthesis protein SpsF (cytidylyltransferase family)